MKTLAFLITLFLAYSYSYAQTLIATSLSPAATANHNQRKIVRDNHHLYVVYTDSVNGESVIKGLIYSFINQQWSTPVILFTGQNPTVAISYQFPGPKWIHLCYQTNDSISRIIHTRSLDFLAWSQCMTISDTTVSSIMPISDVSSDYRLNVFYIQRNDSISESLIYAGILDNNLLQKTLVTTKSTIQDICIANHLLYENNMLLFAIQFNQDSLQFLKSEDYLVSIDTLLKIQGSHPCLSYNNYLSGMSWGTLDPIRLLFIDTNSCLMEGNSGVGVGSTMQPHLIQSGVIDDVCIDDLGPRLGFSFIFIRNDSLFHSFSFGKSYGNWWSTILNTHSGNPLNPSIAYKWFDMGCVDYIWMEFNGTSYNIYYKRAPKISDIQSIESIGNEGFSLTGNPSPFSEVLTIKIAGHNIKALTNLEIMNSIGQLVTSLHPISQTSEEVIYNWNGRNSQGNLVEPGIYFLLSSMNEKKIARKVIYSGNR